MSNSDADVKTQPWVEHLTIGEVLRSTAERLPDQDALVFSESNSRLSWREFDAEVDHVARSLLSIGLSPGDHFGIWATNVPEWVLLQFATARIGVVLVTINPSYSAEELKYTLAQSDIRAMALVEQFKQSHFFEIMKEACPEITAANPGELSSSQFPHLKWVIALSNQHPNGMLSWNQLLSKSESVSQEELDATSAQLKPDEPINIQYTSGTTGSPKGATLSHSNILINAFYGGECQRLGNQDRLCIPVPLYHCFGCVLGTLTCVVHGATMVFPASAFSPGATLHAIEEEGCTSIYGVPTMFIAELQHNDFEQRDLSTLRTGIMAGSPCPIELMKQVTEEMGAHEITIGYGQTEASPLITQTRTNDPIELRVGTVGKPIPGFEAKIIDVETGNALKDGEQGELCGRGHGVMIGYYKMPEKTAQAIDSDGWLHTGDLALREPNGYYRICGRLHDMIIRGGENVYPREIEERLHEHSAVEDVQVVGVPDTFFGEEVLAWVKLKSGRAVTEEELAEFCRSTLARYKGPRYWKFVDQFPTTVTGKIQKFKIREIAISDLGLQDAAEIETA